mmetsp:Transcript_34445/g.90945  ORF Transcript_34445/g.90945 Transcript_34445/m.90945 type:complete len:202 (+) Transcript_34445:182-787(+)
MSRPKLVLNGYPISSYFLDRASEAWHVMRSMIYDLDRVRGGQIRHDDLVAMCKNINCFLPERDIDQIFAAISNGGSSNTGSTKELLDLIGGFIRGKNLRSPTPEYATTKLSFLHPMDTAEQATCVRNKTINEVSASLAIPHFYAVDQSDPTCLRPIGGLRRDPSYYRGHKENENMLKFDPGVLSPLCLAFVSPTLTGGGGQ